MKKLLLLTLLAVAMSANAGNTNEMFIDDDEVFGKEGGIRISDDDDNECWDMHFALGINIPTDEVNGHAFAPFRSWEFNWTIMQYEYTLKNMSTSLSAGIGLDWRQYTLRGHKDCFAKLNDYVITGQFEKDYNDFSSNIHTVALNMPLLVKQRFGKKFAVSVGAQLNWNYYARIHTSYGRYDEDFDVYTKKIGQRPITVDVLGILHFGKIGVYCKYSPMSVLKKERGLEFKSFAAGIYF